MNSADSRKFAGRLHERLPLDETRHLEFKEIKGVNPDDSIPKEAEKYAVGFLNSEGGTIVWGVRDSDKTVVGVVLSDASRDRIRCDVVEKLGRIQPKVDDRRFRLEILPLAGVPEGEQARFLVTLEVPHIPAVEPFYTGSGECFVRLDGVLKQKKGPDLTHYIHSLRPHPTAAAPIEDPRLAALVKRLRQILEIHGLQPGHMAQFLEARRAPFTISLNDQRSDAMFLLWLSEEKIGWIARTFLIRREWINGEDDQIHDTIHFDKQPRLFWEMVQSTKADVIFHDTLDSPEAFFVRIGKRDKWPTGDDSRVTVIFRIPLVRLSNELTIYQYIRDASDYPWDYPRTNIQLRAWSRLMHNQSDFQQWGCVVSKPDLEKLTDNSLFLPQTIIAADRGRHAWHPEDYGVGRDAGLCSSIPEVIEFLTKYDLPTD